ncbi:MAG: hypothetical protein V2A71_08605 [Candidatus Eisenbacteria bacterium]
MDSIKLLEAPEYTEKEREALVDFVLALKKSHIKDFLKKAELRRTGTKPDLRGRIQDALDAGTLTYEKIVEFLDSVAPWGKQHVFLYRGPLSDFGSWKDPESLLQRLKEHRLGRLFNARLPLILPEQLTLSSVTHADGKLRVSAIQKREYAERTEEYDKEEKTEDGEKVDLRAYVCHLTRAIVAFEWDLIANVAMLQITQLQSDGDYEEVEGEFTKLISPWLDFKHFTAIDLRPVIRKLHEIEDSGQPEARSHGYQYRSPQGRRVSAQSPSPRDSVRGEDYIDKAMASVRKNGVGHIGNFYWLGGVKPGPVENPLNGEVHVIIVAANSRVNFPTPNTEERVRYVLHRIRTLS